MNLGEPVVSLLFKKLMSYFTAPGLDDPAAGAAAGGQQQWLTRLGSSHPHKRPGLSSQLLVVGLVQSQLLQTLREWRSRWHPGPLALPLPLSLCLPPLLSLCLAYKESFFQLNAVFESMYIMDFQKILWKIWYEKNLFVDFLFLNLNKLTFWMCNIL